MIVTELKPFDDIVVQLKGVKRIFLLGCGDCATMCDTGSEEVLLKQKAAFEEKGFEVVGVSVPDVGCNAAKVKISFARSKEALKKAGAIVVFSCGLGAQSVRVNAREQKKIIIACDTLYSGLVDRNKQIQQVCSLCGECALSETGSFCVETLCPKEMSNGPCGGVSGGKCEVYPGRECVWVSIYKKIESGKGSVLERIVLPKRHSKHAHPQSKIIKK